MTRLKRFGQYEEFDPGMWESSIYDADYGDYYTWNNIETDTGEWPSETRFLDIYQQQVDAAGAVVAGGGGLLDIVKSILGIAAPVITSALTAQQLQAQAEAQQAAKTAAAKAGASPLTAGFSLSSITSNLPLLAAIGLGAYFLLGRRKGSSPGRRRARKRGRR